MPNVKQAYGTPATITITLGSLGKDTGRAGTAIDNNVNRYNSADIRVRVKTGATTGTANDYVVVYLIRSSNGTNYDDSFVGNDATYTPINAILLGMMTTVTAATTYEKIFDVTQLGLTLPRKWAIGILNKTAGALDATPASHSVGYTEKYYTVV